MTEAAGKTAGRERQRSQPALVWPGWLLLLLALAALWVPGMVDRYGDFQDVSPAGEEALREAYLSARAHALYHTMLDALFVLTSAGVGAAILWRRRSTRLAVPTAFVLLAWGAANGLVVAPVGPGPVAVVAGVAGWGSMAWLGHRAYEAHRSDPSPRERQNVHWLWYGMAVSAVTVGAVLATLGSPLWLGEVQVDRVMTAHLLLALGGAAFPAAAAIAFLGGPSAPDPDTLIGRTMVYGGLTAIVVAGTMAVVVLPALFYYELGPVYFIVSVAAWAVLGLPLQRWLQRRVNRLLYGDRDEPLSVLNNLGQRLELGSPETVLASIVETVAQALKLPAVRIVDGETGSVLASVGRSGLEALAVPIVHQSREVGTLMAYPRARDEALDDRDLDLLRLVARQAGPTVSAVNLNQELRRSRQEILESREEERRRIRRDLHDGLGPSLAAIAMQADTARAVVDEDPETARELLQEVTRQSEEVIQEVRRLVYGLRPPALDELGLAGALERVARQGSSAGLSVSVESEARELPALPAAVEVAMYRIVSEAVTNVVRHSGASECIIRVRADSGVLAATIEDNGRGIRDDAAEGVGMRSMRDRANEVGGTVAVTSAPERGTRVRVELPLGVPA